MPLHIPLFILAGCGLIVGSLAIWLIRSTHSTAVRCGRWLCFFVLGGLGIAKLVGASYCTQSMGVLGLVAGMLMIAMVFESPTPQVDGQGS